MADGRVAIDLPLEQTHAAVGAVLHLQTHACDKFWRVHLEMELLSECGVLAAETPTMSSQRLSALIHNSLYAPLEPARPARCCCKSPSYRSRSQGLLLFTAEALRSGATMR